MDKLDQNIETAKQTHTPSPDFVPSTMNRVEATSPIKTRRFNWKVWAPVVGGVAIIAIVATVLLIPHNSTTSTSNTATTTPSTTPTNSQPANTINPSDTSNTALDSDLNNINSSMNQASTDQSSADSAINDNQQQITIPAE